MIYFLLGSACGVFTVFLGYRAYKAGDFVAFLIGVLVGFLAVQFFT